MAPTDPAGTQPMTAPARASVVLPAARFGELLRLLYEDGYAVHGPAVQDGTIALAPISDAAVLPHGWTVKQAPGASRLERRDDGAVFGFTHGADSWKRLLHPARVRLWAAERGENGFTVREDRDPIEPRALLGVRACDLRAIAVQDKVFQGGAHVDAAYAAHRAGAFIVAVDCGEPGGTCFCHSMGTGPAAESGYDLALTELDAGAPATHRFVVRVGSARGQALIDRLAAAPADDADHSAVAAAVATARTKMGRALDPEAARTLLASHRESPRWQDVAQRCLTCGNCTMVCPTCFCTTVEDTSDLSGDIAERWRLWDSCFTFAFSYIVGGSVRETAGARYRHWISHKLSTWYEQFGESGCVGCGRCITWCPVGIDITAEVAALQEDGIGARQTEGGPQ
jgi:sulfhydrogenase subunit beta (sulfur reductase)